MRASSQEAAEARGSGSLNEPVGLFGLRVRDARRREAVALGVQRLLALLSPLLLFQSLLHLRVVIEGFAHRHDDVILQGKQILYNNQLL